MSDRIWIKYDELQAVSTQLLTIVEELESAHKSSDTLKDAIGSPYGRRSLQDKAGDFEKRWNDRRKDLARDIKKVQEHVQGVLDGVQEWDTQTAASLEVDVTGQENGTR